MIAPILLYGHEFIFGLECILLQIAFLHLRIFPYTTFQSMASLFLGHVFVVPHNRLPLFFQLPLVVFFLGNQRDRFEPCETLIIPRSLYNLCQYDIFTARDCFHFSVIIVYMCLTVSVTLCAFCSFICYTFQLPLNLGTCQVCCFSVY